MTLALRLSQQGKAVTLFEASPSLGGLAGAWRLGDVIWDRHYHVSLSSDAYLRSLLRELGLEKEMRWTTTRTGFYIDSELYSLSTTLEFLKFPVLGLVDKLRLGATILYASTVTDWKMLETIPVTEWLEKWSGRTVLDKVWIPLLRAKLGDNYRETSAAFIWASIARMYAARRGGMKKESFGYVPGGYACVIHRFADTLERAGVKCRMGKPVKTLISGESGGVRVDLLDGTREIFDQSVVTVAAPLVLRLCPQLSAAEKSQLSNIKYQGIICASLLLKQPLSNFYITNIADRSVPYTAVIEMTALVPREHFGGRSLVYLPMYLPSDAPEFKLTDEQLQHWLSGVARENVSSLRPGRSIVLSNFPSDALAADSQAELLQKCAWRLDINSWRSHCQFEPDSQRNVKRQRNCAIGRNGSPPIRGATVRRSTARRHRP